MGWLATENVADFSTISIVPLNGKCYSE